MKSRILHLAIVAAVTTSAILNFNLNDSLAAGVNLIPNPGFEEAEATDPTRPANWHESSWGSVQATFVYPAPGISNTSAVSVTVNSTQGTGDAKWYFDDVPVDANQTYVFGTHYRADVATEIDARYLFSDGTYSYAWIASVPASADWTNVTFSFTAPANAVSVTIFHAITDVGTLTTDDVSLEVQDVTPPPPPPPTPTSTASLIPNFDLESANASLPSGWSRGGWGTNSASFQYPAADATGGNAERIDMTSWTSGDAKWIHPAVSITGGQIYTFSDDYQSDITTNLTLQFELSDGSYTYAWLADLPASGAWTNTGGLSFTAPANAVRVTVFHLINKVGFLQTDNYILTEQGTSPPPPPPPPPVPTSTASLITNYDFEVADSGNTNLPVGWAPGGWGNKTATFQYPVNGPSGSSAARVDITAYTDGDAKWVHPAVTVTGGQMYTFSDDYQSDVTSNITLQFKLSDGSYSYAWLADLPASGVWVNTGNLSIQVPANATEITVFHLINGIGYLQTDNYVLTSEAIPPPPPPPPPVNTNLFVNGDLEIPKPNNPALPQSWSHDSWGTLKSTFTYPVADSSTGTAAVRVEITSYTSGDAKWVPSMISISPNTTYTFSDVYRSNVVTEVSLEYTLSDGTKSYAWVNAPPAEANWTPISYSFTTPANAVGVTVFHLILQKGWLETDNYVLSKNDAVKFNQPMITLVFDDGTSSIYDNAMPIVDAAGIKTTQAIISGYLDYAGYMNVAQVMELKNNGHEIASHTRTHAHLTQLNQTQLQSEIVGSKDDLVAMGFGPINTLVYPYGEYNNEVTQFIKDSGYYIGARTVDEGFNYTNTDPYLLMDKHVGITTTVQQIKDDIDLAIANNSWLILELHDVNYAGDPYSTTPEVLQGIVDYIKSTGINTVTLNDGLQILNN